MARDDLSAEGENSRSVELVAGPVVRNHGQNIFILLEAEQRISRDDDRVRPALHDHRNMPRHVAGSEAYGEAVRELGLFQPAEL